MSRPPGNSCTAFIGTTRIASGSIPEVALKAKSAVDHDEWAQLLIFDDVTSCLLEVDLRGSAEDVLQRTQKSEAAETAEQSGNSSDAPEETRRPGRPKLGVVAREVTLLPRHWERLASQPGGASVALRKLVEQARRSNQGRDHQRRAQESAYRFLSAIAGNEPGFAEASRAPFAGNREQFISVTEAWPIDIQQHARKLATAAFAATHSSSPIAVK